MIRVQEPAIYASASVRFVTASMRRLAAWCAAAILALLPVIVSADEITLKTGRKIEGLVIRHTKTFLVLNVGVGEMQIQSNQIRRIAFGTREGNDRLRATWKKNYYLSSAYVPKGLDPLARSFAALEDSRQTAIHARATLARLGRDEERLPREILTLREQIQSTSQRLSRAPTNTFEDVTAYNQLVMENNGLVTQLNSKGVEYQGLADARRKAQSTIADYMQALDAFDVELRKQRATHAKDGPQATYFLAELEKKVTAYHQDFSRVTVPTSSGQGGGHMVSVNINGRDAGRFIIDTGASIITLSRATAKKLRLDTTNGRPAEMTMADGSKVKAMQIVLASVQVGEAKAINVPAVVLPNAVGQDISGLLGMSFLQNFNMSLDGSTGNLVLKEFAPR